MTRDEAVEMIRGAGVGEHAEELVGLLRPSARMILGETGEDGEKSYLGGKPRLAEGTLWPRWNPAEHFRRRIADAERQCAARPNDMGLRDYLEGMKQGLGEIPLAFLGQVDLGEMAEQAAVPGWPTQGVLLFFYECLVCPWGFDPGDRGGCRVIYYPAGTEQVEAEPPIDLSVEFQFPQVGVRFEPEWTLPTEIGRERLADLGFLSAHMKLLAELAGTVDASGVIHRCGGHADEVQGEMRLLCQLASHGIYCGDAAGLADVRRGTLEGGTGDWELLLQVDSDEENLGWMWGDLGRVYFWVRKQDMARLDFESPWAVLQCS